MSDYLLLDSLAYELAANWRWPTFAQRIQSELSHMAGAVDDGTVNIILGMIFILVLICSCDLQQKSY